MEVTKVISEHIHIDVALRFLDAAATKILNSNKKCVLTISDGEADHRSLSQNDKQWPMLRDIAQQVKLNGRAHDEAEWKIILTSSYRPQKFVFGVDGSLVALSFSTSKAKKSEMCDIIEIYYAYGSECGVNWSEQSLKQYQSYRETQHGV